MSRSWSKVETPLRRLNVVKPCFFVLMLLSLISCDDPSIIKPEGESDMEGPTGVEAQRDRGSIESSDMLAPESDMMAPESDMMAPESDMMAPESDMMAPESDMEVLVEDMQLPEVDMMVVLSDRDGDGVTTIEGDCDDNDRLAYPGNMMPSSGRDYDCDGLVDYVATLRVIVDNGIRSLCVNGETVAGVCVEESDCAGASGSALDSWNDRTSETYEFIAHGGQNVIALHGIDTSGVISGAALWLRVGGRVIPSRGVAPSETDDTAWRYDPLPEAEGKLGWCDPYFDDSTWSPAVRAGELFDNVWITSPSDQYGPTVEWIWDSTPNNLADAYFRLNFRLPQSSIESPHETEDRCELISEPTLFGQDQHTRDPHIIRAHDSYWSAASVHCCAFRGGASEIFVGQGSELSDLVGEQIKHFPGDWWSQQTALAHGENSVALVWADSRDNRSLDRVYTSLWNSEGEALQSQPISNQSNTKNPAVGYVEDGYSVVWQTGSGNNNAAYDISWARLSENGLISNLQEVIIGGPEASQRPKVIAWPYQDADALVVWEGTIPSNVGELARRGIWAQRFLINGTSVGEAILIDPTADLSQAPIDQAVWPRNISLAKNSSSIAIVWEGDYSGDQEVYSRIIGEGATLSPLQNISEDRHASRHPVVKTTSTGFVVIWGDDRSGMPQLTLRSMDLLGALNGPSKLIPTPSLRTFKPDFVVTGPDQYTILFEAESIDEPLHRAQARRAHILEVSCE